MPEVSYVYLFVLVALAGGVVEQINYWSLDHIGLFLQYFCVGICYSCSISVNYEFFTSYMGQSGDFFNVALSAISLPWSFKVKMTQDLFIIL